MQSSLVGDHRNEHGFLFISVNITSNKAQVI